MLEKVAAGGPWIGRSNNPSESKAIVLRLEMVSCCPAFFPPFFFFVLAFPVVFELAVLVTWANTYRKIINININMQ
jgi:hypothetical protein